MKDDATTRTLMMVRHMMWACTAFICAVKVIGDGRHGWGILLFILSMFHDLMASWKCAGDGDER